MSDDRYRPTFDVRFLFSENDYGRHLDFALVTMDEHRHIDAAAVNIVSEKLPEGERIPTCMSITRESAQSIVDELHRLGFRPTTKEPPQGELAATKYHLEDMRRLVFKEE